MQKMADGICRRVGEVWKMIAKVYRTAAGV